MRFYLLPQSFVLTWPQYEVRCKPRHLELMGTWECAHPKLSGSATMLAAAQAPARCNVPSAQHLCCKYLSPTAASALQIEGIPLALRLDVPNAAAAWVEINRQTLTVSDGGSNDNFINNPAPQPGAAPSPGPDTTGEDQPGASPTPATSANAGAASPTRSPARSPAADVHTSDATANTLLSSVAVVGAALAAVLAA
jgi:hypothetical protein